MNAGNSPGNGFRISRREPLFHFSRIPIRGRQRKHALGRGQRPAAGSVVVGSVEQRERDPGVADIDGDQCGRRVGIHTYILVTRRPVRQRLDASLGVIE